MRGRIILSFPRKRESSVILRCRYNVILSERSERRISGIDSSPPSAAQNDGKADPRFRGDDIC